MKQIIVVEDDSSILEPMIIMLNSAGYLVTTFLNGAPILANDFDLPDMFIMDKQLTGVDGLELCKHLKSQEQTKNIPVIMVSANSSIKMLAKNALADDALEKPFRMKEFLETVARHI